MTLSLQSFYRNQPFEMSEYVSDTPQTRYTHVTGALHTLNAHLTHACGMLQKRPAKVRLKALRNRNVQVAYTACLKLALNASVTC